MMTEGRCFPCFKWKSKRSSAFLGCLLFIMFICLLVTIWNDNGVNIKKLQVGRTVSPEVKRYSTQHSGLLQ